jgi:F0F1-type ATP synthase delta subunit
MTRRTDRLTAEQRAEVTARVTTWPKLTEAQRENIRALFAGHEFPQTHFGKE